MAANDSVINQRSYERHIRKARTKMEYEDHRHYGVQ